VISDANITALKDHAGTRPYQSRVTKWKQLGSNKAEACCRFHDDASPSLAVDKKDGEWVFYCMPCQLGGDVFAFVQKVDKITFPQAYKKVAEETGFSEEENESEHQPYTPFVYNAGTAVSRLAEIEPFLSARGVSMNVAQAAGLGVIDHPIIGKSVSIPYGVDSENGTPVIKVRALKPKSKKHKFRHLQEATSAHLLFGVQEVTESLWMDPQLWVVESELDCLMLRSHGLNAVSVSSATTCLKDGKLKFDIPTALVEGSNEIFLALDQDDAGNICTKAFESVLPTFKTFRLKWPYQKETADLPKSGHKDIGELYAADPCSFSERLNSLATEAANRPPAWRARFRKRSELDQGDVVSLIERFLYEGTTFLSGLSGDGKTLLALSIAKALVTGKPFLGRFAVPRKQKVLYLVPEMGERAFRRRLDAFQMPDEGFLCMTMHQGLMNLADPDLAAAIKDGYTVVILDTAIRFSDAESENDNSQNANGLAKAFIALRQMGALAILPIHHSPKSTAKMDWLSVELEDALRGAGDIGAIGDIVYYIRMLDDTKTEIGIKNVKPRDFEPVPPFRIQGRPYIDNTGDFVMLSDEKPALPTLGEAIAQNLTASYRELAKLTGIPKNDVKEQAADIGWIKSGNQESSCWEKRPPN
jgi:AAA domain/CHC2 zinc finger